MVIIDDNPLIIRANAPCRRPQSCSQHYGTLTIFSAVSASLSHLCQNHGMVSNPDTNNRRRQTGILCVYIYICVYSDCNHACKRRQLPCLKFEWVGGGCVNMGYSKKSPNTCIFYSLQALQSWPRSFGITGSQRLSYIIISYIKYNHTSSIISLVHDS